jgi:hypothetical protein
MQFVLFAILNSVKFWQQALHLFPFVTHLYFYINVNNKKSKIYDIEMTEQAFKKCPKNSLFSYSLLLRETGLTACPTGNQLYLFVSVQT